MSTTSDQLLSIKDGYVYYAGKAGAKVPAVKGASFDIAPGEHVAIVGESGSGKTTLALAVAGLLTAAGASCEFGEFVFDGRTIERGKIAPVPYRTPGTSMVFQNAMTSLDPVATIGSQFVDVLRGLSRISRKKARAVAAEWLVSVGLHDTDRILKLRPYELSGGMRQRVMLALALCSEPKLLLADEPTSALDASVSRDVMDLLRSMTERTGASLLIVTHDIDLVRLYVDKVVVMYHGEVVDVCNAGRIEEEAQHPYTLALTRCVPTLDAYNLDRLPTLDETMTAGFRRGEGESKAAMSA
ncbi:ABC transporter ATP-binding protein [Nocardioides bruguierae]|uniref:ABC transporter ATP-binding protein n=1 Tax=Nocardioides bruguierae TaxID=2945102 RepID=A0A9X2D8J8_9ACTN|nr:ABC transporter ATP-binding protein [Nocardioides bruguierae]MCM0621140.1 ABC transporter ATP-binding protein [Nocardioides bruguierae]